jgi:hypothetical protein
MEPLSSAQDSYRLKLAKVTTRGVSQPIFSNGYFTFSNINFDRFTASGTGIG